MDRAKRYTCSFCAHFNDRTESELIFHERDRIRAGGGCPERASTSELSRPSVVRCPDCSALMGPNPPNDLASHQQDRVTNPGICRNIRRGSSGIRRPVVGQSNQAEGSARQESSSAAALSKKDIVVCEKCGQEFDGRTDFEAHLGGPVKADGSCASIKRDSSSEEESDGRAPRQVVRSDTDVLGQEG